MACFNDDVQGTGCVTLAAIMAALHVSGQKLADIRMVVFGAGSAGVGIADQVRDAVVTEGKISQDEASKKIWYALPLMPSLLHIGIPIGDVSNFARLIDKPGLLTTETETSDAQKSFIKDTSEWKNKGTDLLSVVREIKPNVLIGTSTVPGAFTEVIVKAMADGCARPIIFPLSNPTRLHEAKPFDILHWTDGKALVATGSPFEPVKGPWGDKGADISIDVAECNNSVVFPGIGLGCILSRAKLLSDRMLVSAVHAVAELSPALKDSTAPLLPGVEDVRHVSLRVARAVIQTAMEDGLATEEGIPGDVGALDAWIAEQMWLPEYRPLRLVSMEDASRSARGELRQAGTVNRTDEL